MRISSSLRKGKYIQARILLFYIYVIFADPYNPGLPHLSSLITFFLFFRMPNIRKLVLPRWSHLSENSYQFAFRQWKNLQTLIIDQRQASLTWRHEIRASGENCINLTNLKIMGCLNEAEAGDIVRWFPNLKKLSLRFCDIIDIGLVLPLITSLKHLTILNLSHCRFRHERCGYIICSRELETILIKIDRYKCETLIMLCLNLDCKFCEKAYCIGRSHAFFEKNWRNDEIEEFEFWNVVKICWWLTRLSYSVRNQH